MEKSSRSNLDDEQGRYIIGWILRKEEAMAGRANTFRRKVVKEKRRYASADIMVKGLR